MSWIQNFKSDDYEKVAGSPEHFGRMNDPTSAASVKGPCGDEMEFYLVIKNSCVEQVKFYTKGCSATRACGARVAEWTEGGTVEAALDISPGKVLGSLKGLPEDHKHCAILAVTTLYRAIADYMLMP